MNLIDKYLGESTFTKPKGWELNRKGVAKKFKTTEDIIEIIERWDRGVYPNVGAGIVKKVDWEEMRNVAKAGFAVIQEDPQKISSQISYLNDKGKEILRLRRFYYNEYLNILKNDLKAEVPKDVLKDFPNLKKTAKNLR